MKITYAISPEDFRSLQSPFAAKPGLTLGFKAALAFFAAFTTLGVVLIAQGSGLAVGGFLIVLAAAGAGAAYFFEKRSVANSKLKYERNIAAAYQGMHCRDARTLETSEEGFTASCKCGTLTRPWAQLSRVVETNRLFLIGTRTDQQIVPKSAFHSEGEITEFRAAVSAKLNDDKPITARAIDFRYTKRDFHQGILLNIAKAGGWRKLSWSLIALFGWVEICYWAGKYLAPSQDPALVYGFIAAMFAGILIRAAKVRRRKHYFGPLRLYFSDEGMHVQYPATLARMPWTQFIGYLEDEHVILLYQTPRLYSVIPKRVLADRAAEFRAIVESKVKPYNYRAPMRVGFAQQSGTPAQQ